MKLAVVGSRKLKNINLNRYIPPEADEIISGGAVGADRCAAVYAKEHGIRLTVFYPDYDAFGISAPHIRNEQIIRYADAVLAFCDGESKGTASVIEKCQRYGVPVKVVWVKNNNQEGNIKYG